MTFHNSFRAFLIERTRELPALGGETELFTELANHCAAVDAREPERADELYYRARAGDIARVLTLADPASFREQLVAGRSATTIRDDLALALDAAIATRDIVATTRILLCSAEFAQREHYGELLPLAETRLELGDIDLALGALREGASLRTSREVALRAAQDLDERGFATEARDIFTLAEPLDVLRGTGERTGHPREEMDVLEAWIAVAPRFRSTPVILEMIERVRAVADGIWSTNEHESAAASDAETEARRCGLLQSFAMTLDRLGRWDEGDAARATLRTRDNEGGWWFWTQSAAWNDALAAGEQRRAEERFAVVRDAYERGEISTRVLQPPARVAVAGGYLRLGRDAAAARRVLEGVNQPALVTDGTHGHDDAWRPFHQRFALNRVLGALGDHRPLYDIVPDAPPPTAGVSSRSDEATPLVVQFERRVAHLGRLAGRAWMDDRLSASEFEGAVGPLVALFPERSHHVLGAYAIIRARDEFYTRLVGVAAAHGVECVAALRRLLEGQWSEERARDEWPDSLVRSVVTELVSVGAPAAWAQSWLARIEPMTFRGDDLESGLRDGVAQARAWVAAGDIVAARTTLERVSRATFGNESKDDQLIPCLGWAVRANREDPVQTPQRLAQMARAVAGLDGTEAQSYVARDLLEAGIEVGPRPARALVEWALRNDVRGWVDALTILIDGFAARAPAAAGALSTCYRSLVLPFARAANVEVIANLSAGLRKARDTHELDKLCEAIEVAALGSTRNALRVAFAGRQDDAEELLRDEGVTDPTAPGQVVDAFDGLSLTLRELQKRVRAVSDVEDLAHRLKPSAYLYRWDLILRPFVERATADDLVATAAALPQNEYAWRGLAMIAERLLTLGDVRVRPVIERVINGSRPAGWWPRYDGGSRLVAYELLVRSSPEDGRRSAWDALRKDVAAGEVSPISVFHAWDRIVAMLAPNTSAATVWDVVSRHVGALVAYAPDGEAAALPAAEDSGDAVSVTAELTGLVAAKLDHPGRALAQGAQQYFTDRLLAGDTTAEGVLRARLADTDAPKHGALLVLRAVARVRGSVPNSVHEALRGLRRTPHYADRRAAGALIGSEERLGVTNAPTTIHRPLPGVFQLVYPPAPPPHRDRLPARGETLPPAEDAADFVSVFRPELDLIARWADVQPEALYRYVVERATATVPAGGYAYDDEAGVRSELRCLGLEIAYRRPRPQCVERAMGEATAMLVDHGRLGEQYFPALDRLFRDADPYFLLARPSRRPQLIAAISERGNSQYVGNDWTAGVSSSPAVTGRTWVEGDKGATLELERPDTARDGDGAGASSRAADTRWIVLAEESWLRWLDWKLATETRVGARLEPRVWAAIDPNLEAQDRPDPDDVDGETAAGQALDAHVAEFAHLTVDEYLTRARSSYSAVVRNVTYRFETPGGRWLAFNPALAEYIGWQPAPDGLFRWLDADGRVAAESVWWQDGFTQQRPPQFEDEVGHGWLVRVSASAWRQVASTVGTCVDWRRVARIAQDQPPTGIVERTPVTDVGVLRSAT